MGADARPEIADLIDLSALEQESESLLDEIDSTVKHGTKSGA
jgi:hypothetical protein